MERLITVQDMRDRYGCSLPTARKYLRQMFHYENPMTAPGWAFDEWEKSRERMPTGSRPGHTAINHRKSAGRVIVPRHR